MNNFENLTLVSLGDSFTFGQGIIAPPEELNMKTYSVYCSETHGRNYTGLLEKKLNFKNSIQLGVPGGANSTVLNQLISLSDKFNNDFSNLFFVISLTEPTRDSILTFSNDHNAYVNYEFKPNTLLEQKAAKKTGSWIEKSDIYKMSKNTVNEMYGYYLNDYTIMSKHIQILFSIIDLLRARNAKFIIFDMLNKALESFNNMSLDQIKLSGHPIWINRYYNINLDTISIYVDKILNNHIPEYLNSINITKNYTKYINTDITIKSHFKQNMTEYVLGYSYDVLGDKNSTASTVPDDFHWNDIGHDVCSDLLKDWILKSM